MNSLLLLYIVVALFLLVVVSSRFIIERPLYDPIGWLFIIGMIILWPLVALLAMYMLFKGEI